MPEIAVRTLLQNEVIAALKTAPVLALLNTTDGKDGVYPAERLDVPDGYAPLISPHIVVDMPSQGASTTHGPSICQATMTVNLRIYQCGEDHREADTDMSHFTNAIAIALSGNSYTANMRKIGGYSNAALIGEGSWATNGQDQCYLLPVSYGLTFPIAGFVTVA